jgi:glycosyltransferase involved in cell wall biosynthesis
MVHIVFATQHWIIPKPGFTQKQFFVALAKKCEKIGGAVIGCHPPLFILTGLAKLRRPVLRRIVSLDVLYRQARNFFFYTPLLLIPPSRGKYFGPISGINKVLFLRQTKQLLTRFGTRPKDAVVWCFHPLQRYIYDLFENTTRVYRVFDNYDEEPFWNAKEKEQIRNNEKHFLGTADLVIASSSVLREDKIPHRNDVHWVPNGVDFGVFSQALRPDCRVPQDIEQYPRPRIGFVGKLNFKIDFALVNYLARSRPNASFLFIGPNDGTEEFNSSQEFKEAQRISNIHFLGTRPYESLPCYLKGFDACIIPFVINEYTKRIYPLKVHEYLAAGRPVVSTPLPDLLAFSEVVGIADNKEHYLELLDSAVIDKSSEKVCARLEVARQNSWDARAQTVLELLKSLRG